MIKPLTEVEKAAKLAELKERMAARREAKRLQEIEDSKANEKIRRATGQQILETKERLAELEMKKQAEAKKREKEEERVAKERIKALLEQDKLERARKAEEKKRGTDQPMSTVQSAPVSQPVPAVSSKDYSEARLQIRLPSGPPLTETFQAEETLDRVYAFLGTKFPGKPYKLMQTFPRKLLDGADRSKTLKELGLTPSAALNASL